MEPYTFSPLKPKVVLGIAAHPDDLDFGAAGTMATFALEGAQIYYFILTDGGKGSEDRTMTSQKLKQIRQQEQREAGKIIGLSDVFFGNYHDGELENSLAVKKDVVRIVRKVKPDVVVTLDPAVLYSAKRGFINHPDHRAAGQAALDAIFPLARDHMTFPELLAEGYEPHKTTTALLISFDQSNFAVDISHAMEIKLQAIAAHTSQVGDMEATRKRMHAWAEDVGKQYQMPHAESFMRIDIA